MLALGSLIDIPAMIIGIAALAGRMLTNKNTRARHDFGRGRNWSLVTRVSCTMKTTSGRSLVGVFELVPPVTVPDCCRIAANRN